MPPKVSQPNKSGQCAYCGEIRLLTRDHIPPQNLFPSPRADNLITVPCCEICRQGWSKDDEYFRTAIILSDNVSEERLAQTTVSSVLRSLDKPKKQGFRRAVFNNIGEIDIRTEAGIYISHVPAFKTEPQRISRVGQRIIRGLFFHEKGYPIPSNYLVEADIKQTLPDEFIQILQDIEFSNPRIIQDGIFWYSFQETHEDPNSMIWIALFYLSLPLIGYVRQPFEPK